MLGSLAKSRAARSAERPRTAQTSGSLEQTKRRSNRAKLRFVGFTARLACLPNPISDVHSYALNVLFGDAATVHDDVSGLFKGVERGLCPLHVAKQVLEDVPVSDNDGRQISKVAVVDLSRATRTVP